MRITTLLLLFPLLLPAQSIAPEEFAARRRALLERRPDGITLLHAAAGEKELSAPGFLQNSTFFYFTGEGGAPNAILALDAPGGRVHLFVPPPPAAFWFTVDGVIPPPGDASAARLGVSSVQPWDSLVPWLRRRIEGGVRTLYVDEARWAEQTGVPDGLAPIAGSQALWRRSLAAAFPSVEVASAAAAIRALRFVKSAAEVAILRDNARATARALHAGVGAVRPGARQRAAEVRVAAGCVEAGAVGPSFWPWMMSGPNALVPSLAKSVYSYTQLDRAMQAGELVRVDIGCTAHGYGADVGRTVPVSGTFTEGQRETWDLLIAAYRAGIARMRGGVAIADVLAASRAEIARQQPTMRTAQGREAAEFLLSDKGFTDWSIHSVGVDSGESALPVLVPGAVIAFEPIFAVGPDAFYLEDMILITESGSDVLSAGVPYSAREIEAMLREARGARR